MGNYAEKLTELIYTRNIMTVKSRLLDGRTDEDKEIIIALLHSDVYGLANLDEKKLYVSRHICENDSVYSVVKRHRHIFLFTNKTLAEIYRTYMVRPDKPIDLLHSEGREFVGVHSAMSSIKDAMADGVKYAVIDDGEPLGTVVIRLDDLIEVWTEEIDRLIDEAKGDTAELVKAILNSPKAPTVEQPKPNFHNAMPYSPNAISIGIKDATGKAFKDTNELTTYLYGNNTEKGNMGQSDRSDGVPVPIVAPVVAPADAPNDEDVLKKHFEAHKRELWAKWVYNDKREVDNAKLQYFLTTREPIYYVASAMDGIRPFPLMPHEHINLAFSHLLMKSNHLTFSYDRKTIEQICYRLNKTEGKNLFTVGVVRTVGDKLLLEVLISAYADNYDTTKLKYIAIVENTYDISLIFKADTFLNAGGFMENLAGNYKDILSRVIDRETDVAPDSPFAKNLFTEY